MKRARPVTAVLALFVLVPLCSAAAVVGTKLENFRLADSSGKMHSLADYRDKIVVLSFWSFKCPVTLGYVKRMRELGAEYRSRGVVILGIDSNSDDSPEAIQKNAESLDLGYPVLIDGDGTLADRLGATHTPSLYILDRNFVVRYEGMIDNGKKPGEKDREAFAEQALDAILAGREVPVPVTKGAGCSIRRKTF